VLDVRVARSWARGVVSVALLLVVAACHGSPAPATGPASSPEQAVQGFLDAVGGGRADDALSFLRLQPTDRTLLTSTVLTKAALPITQVTTHVRGGPKGQRTVDVAYRIGGQRVTDTYQTVLLGDRWYIDESLPTVPSFMDHPDFAPVTIDGIAVKTGGPGSVILDQAGNTLLGLSGTPLLPGRYRFALDHPLLAVDDAEFTVPSLHAPAIMTGDGPHARLTDAGQKKIAAKAQEALDSCLAATTLYTCGFGFDRSQWDDGDGSQVLGSTLVENTATWSVGPGGTDLSRTAPAWQDCRARETWNLTPRFETTVCAEDLVVVVRMSTRTTTGTTRVLDTSVTGYWADISDPDHIQIGFR